MGKEAKYVVRLTAEERQLLEELISRKRIAADKALRARILLKADGDGPAWSDACIAEAFEVGQSTVHRLRQRLVEEGLEPALSRRPLARTKPRKLDGAAEAQLVAIACSQAGRTTHFVNSFRRPFGVWSGTFGFRWLDWLGVSRTPPAVPCRSVDRREAATAILHRLPSRTFRSPSRAGSFV